MNLSVQLSNIHSLAYSVLLCHYVYRQGLSDSELNRRLAENGVQVEGGTDRHLREALTQAGYLEADKPFAHKSGWLQMRYHLSTAGKTFIQNDFQLRYGTKKPSSNDKALGSLKSFLHSIRAYDPF